MKQCEIQIGHSVIGTFFKVFLIAEIGINHNGNVDLAHKLIDAAADGGADAVKFQVYRTDRLTTQPENRASRQAPAEESAYKLFRRMELSWNDYENLKKHADDRRIIFLASVFDEECADFLNQAGISAFKIASGDLTHTPLLRHIGGMGKPILLSTGMSFLSEVADAIWTLKSAGTKEILLFHCVSAYPAPTAASNLRAIQTLYKQFEMPVGYSDHSLGLVVPLAAAAMGAAALEKHFTLDKNADGPDHKLSMDPGELRALVASLRTMEESRGDGRKRPASVEINNRLQGRRSVVAAVDIRAYETIMPWMLVVKRPGSGIEPRYLEQIFGLQVRRNISRNEVLQWEDLNHSIPMEVAAEGALSAHRKDSTSPTPISHE